MVKKIIYIIPVSTFFVLLSAEYSLGNNKSNFKNKPIESGCFRTICKSTEMTYQDGTVQKSNIKTFFEICPSSNKITNLNNNQVVFADQPGEYIKSGGWSVSGTKMRTPTINRLKSARKVEPKQITVTNCLNSR
ncbi:MAG: hypothetical protein P8N18_03215 [Hellea sp.]|nr:hypothetical protein [Hellea sp.]